MKMPVKSNQSASANKMPAKLKLKLANECEDLSKRITLKSTQIKYNFYILSSKQVNDKNYTRMMVLFESLMREAYEKSSWGWDEESKMAEWKHSRTRIILVFKRAAGDPSKNVIFHELPPEENAGGDEIGDNELIAFMCFRFEVGADKSESALYVYELHVQRDFQRQGLGDELMRMARQFAFEFKMEKIMLTSFRSNQQGLQFYNKLNFITDKSSPAKNESDYIILSSKVKSWYFYHNHRVTSTILQATESYSDESLDWQCVRTIEDLLRQTPARKVSARSQFE